MLPDRQRSFGFAMQSLLHRRRRGRRPRLLPWMLANWAGVTNAAAAGRDARHGAAARSTSAPSPSSSRSSWTVVQHAGVPAGATRRVPCAARDGARPRRRRASRSAWQYRAWGIAWILGGDASSASRLQLFGWDQPAVRARHRRSPRYGLAPARSRVGCSPGPDGRCALLHHERPVPDMPLTMRRLAVVQFLSWFGAVRDVDLHDRRR